MLPSCLLASSSPMLKNDLFLLIPVDARHPLLRSQAFSGIVLLIAGQLLRTVHMHPRMRTLPCECPSLDSNQVGP